MFVPETFMYVQPFLPPHPAFFSGALQTVPGTDLHHLRGQPAGCLDPSLRGRASHDQGPSDRDRSCVTVTAGHWDGQDLRVRAFRSVSVGWRVTIVIDGDQT